MFLYLLNRLVFGGRVSDSMGQAAINDVWQYSLLSQSWRELRPLGRRPETRYLHMAAMSQGSMVMFAGEHIEANNRHKKDHKLNDVWSYSLSANAWTQLTVNDCDVTTPLCIALYLLYSITRTHVLCHSRASWWCQPREATCGCSRSV